MDCHRHYHPLGMQVSTDSRPPEYSGCDGTIQRFTFMANEVATITVTYHPDLRILESQLRALPSGCVKIIVDNASNPITLKRIERLANLIDNTLLLKNTTNIGLAAAVNQGAKLASQQVPHPRYLFFLDQDSEPETNVIETLIQDFLKLEKADLRPGCLGANMIDIHTGLSHGFHLATRWRWQRIYPRPDWDQPIACTNLNGSGTLVPLNLFQKLGGLDGSLFIDHVDTEWSFRVLAAGYTLWGHPQARIHHRMGENSLRFWFFGWRVWPLRTPTRHYYLYRNAVILIRRTYIQKVWKFWAVVKLALTMIIHALFDSKRRTQLRAMWRGIRDGSQRRM